MNHYSLYLESGPRKRTTMAHVLDLLGCFAREGTTEAALEAAPDAISAYLHMLKRHGDAVDPEASFTMSVAEHVMEGAWLGYGNPAPGFSPDFEPLTEEELHRLLQRLEWLHADLLGLLEGIPYERYLAEPPVRGRILYDIVTHVAESHKEYFRSALGNMADLTAALRVVKQGPEVLPDALGEMYRITSARMARITEEERVQMTPRGQVIWTAKRMLRRMLEHEWEHILEIEERLKAMD